MGFVKNWSGLLFNCNTPYYGVNELSNYAPSLNVAGEIGDFEEILSFGLRGCSVVGLFFWVGFVIYDCFSWLCKYYKLGKL